MSGRLRILVVDDEPLDRYWTVRALGRALVSAEIREASTLRTAASMLREEPFDCVLLDNILPDGTAVEFLGAVHAPRIPVIVLSGYVDERVGAALAEAGAAAQLVKGKTDPTSLADCIQRCVGSRL
jgi:CheY-like chemotaxis protein